MINTSQQSVENALRSAADEIRQQRRRIELLQAKVSMIELFEMVLHTKAAEHIRGEGVDIAWTCDQVAEHLRMEREEKETVR